jgi:hypothetical protein
MADATRVAEFEDVRMYARLVYGMQSQVLSRAQHHGGGRGEEAASGEGGHVGEGSMHANASAVGIHPLTHKSLMGIVHTKNLDVDSLDRPHDYDGDDDDDEYPSHSRDNGWEISYIDEVADDNIGTSMRSNSHSLMLRNGPPHQTNPGRRSNCSSLQSSLRSSHKTPSETSLVSSSNSNHDREEEEEEYVFSLDL